MIRNSFSNRVAAHIAVGVLLLFAPACTKDDPMTAPPEQPAQSPAPLTSAELYAIDVVFGSRVGLFTSKGNGQEREPLAYGDFRRMAISPDSKSVAYVRDDVLYVSATDASGEQQIMSGVIDRPAWSPDGTHIVAATVAGLYIIDTDKNSTHSARQITKPQALRDSYASFSPDGRKIAFTRIDPDWIDSILIVDATETSTPELPKVTVLYASMNASSPVWSPEGSTIAFVSQGTIYTKKSDGTAGAPQRIVTRTGNINNIDDWSRDGKWIAYAVNAVDHLDNYISDFEGREGRLNSNELWGAAQLRKVEHVAVTPLVSDTLVFAGMSFVYPTPRMSYIIYPDGRFLLRYVDAGYEYPGRYAADGNRFTLRFDGDARWEATAELAGNQLTVRYNQTMQLSDFVDGTFIYLPGVKP